MSHQLHPNPENLCEVLNLCSVRKRDEQYFVGVKDGNGNITEIPFADIANNSTYQGKPLIRIYSSGHIFLDNTREKVYLITTEKNGRRQHQFTGGSPLEEVNKDVFFEIDGTIKIRLDAAEENAEIRTFNRTGVRVTEAYNEIPLVDWVLMENLTDNSWKFICLMHWIVKSYTGTLDPKIGTEDVIGGEWFEIDTLSNTLDVAPNVYIVTAKAQEFLQANK